MSNKPVKSKRRRIGGFVLLAATTSFAYFLSKPIGDIPALGPLLNPFTGCWANAEAFHNESNISLSLPTSSQATVWFDDQMVPHIHASSEYDLYFLEGYIHAKYRLWQMDMQTRAAAGRLSEIVGNKAFAYDRRQRRKGMIYAAEQSLATAEKDPRTKLMLSAYTDGINQWIKALSVADLPLEYKLLGFTPEPWTNLKSTLLLKYMADDLTGRTDDIAHSYLRALLSESDFNLLYPNRDSGTTPVIPAGTTWDKPSLSRPTAPADSLAFPHFTMADFTNTRQPGIGSNNWAVGPSRTANHAAILCNDPHLALNLPSLWFKIQLQAPGINAYGASLPGAPGIVIGFNENMSWGLTNNYRDVKDYYEITPSPTNSESYLFAGKEVPYTYRYETIRIKGAPDFTDTIRYTVHGPLLYDQRYRDNCRLKKPLAMCWMGLRPTNELLAVYLLNKAGNYNDFVEAIAHFECPAQNFIYADKQGNIALWGQGRFVNKWPEQGRFVMNGSDSATLWQQLIPTSENPHALNPTQGYLASANQTVTDSTFPYWYNGDFTEFRAWRINEVLAQTSNATVNDMFALQQDDLSILGRNIAPIMLRYYANVHNEYIDSLRSWDFHLHAGSQAATVFQVWWYFLHRDIWKDDIPSVPDNVIPSPERTMQLIMADTALKYYDNLCTKDIKETLWGMVNKSYKEAADSLNHLKKETGSLKWYMAKNTSVMHLTKLPAFSTTNIATGGWGNAVNAMKQNHGPSWRMVVQMGPEVTAYGIYPGGQSGNPGSPWYDNLITKWADGKYDTLLFLPASGTQTNNHITYQWAINNTKK